MATFAKWDVPKDFADPMANYLVYGYEPGSCFSAVLANDFIGAIRSSHPSNTVEAFKALAGWILDCVPREAHGSYDAVSNWCSLPPEARRQILEESRLIYTEARELWMTLEGRPTQEPVLY
jgi:hypothetical protein